MTLTPMDELSGQPRHTHTQNSEMGKNVQKKPYLWRGKNIEQCKYDT